MFSTRNIKLTLEYDGTNYGGWQRQKNTIAIQQVLEAAINNITKEKIEVVGCSRTDAGVHARGYVANFYTASLLRDDRFIGAINSQLPEDIVVLNAEEVDEAFHSRYNSIGKTYSYTILNRMQPSAIQRNYAYYYRYKLDINAMKIGAQYLIGKHDFSAFKNTGSSVKTSVRTITELDIYKENDIIKIYASADGFLYNMVRIIVGTLRDVGIGKINPEEVKSILISKERVKAGKSVPPQGLCLEKVYY